MLICAFGVEIYVLNKKFGQTDGFLPYVSIVDKLCTYIHLLGDIE